MKVVAVLLFLALAVFGVRAQDAATEIAVAEPLSAMEEAPAIDAASEVEETENEAVEEGEVEEEGEAEDEAEAEEEDEFSLIEAQAEAEATEDAPKKAVKIPSPPKKAVKIVRAGKKRRAPRALKKAKSFKFHPERVVEARTSKYDDPEMAKLNLALAAVKEDILSTNKQITDERKWVIAVAKIIASYNDKMKRVEAHIIALRKEMKSLYRKKKQIENLKLQRALEAKLKEARDELATLTSSLKHVATKQGELNKSGADLRNTIAGIQAQLAKLRGQKLRKPKSKFAARKRCGKGKRFSKKAKKCVPRTKRAAKKAVAKKAKKF